MTIRAFWATRAAVETKITAGATEVLPKPTKAESHAHEGDVDGVEHGVAAHPFAAAQALRQRQANQARQIKGQGAKVRSTATKLK